MIGIIKEIAYKITELENKINTIVIEDNSELIKEKQIIDENSELSDFDFLDDLDIKKLKDMLPESFSHDLIRLTYYQKSLKTRRININLHQTQEKIQIIKEILFKIEEYINIQEIRRKSEQTRKEKYLQSKNILIKLSKKLQNGDELDENDLEIAYEYAKKMDDRSAAVDFFIQFGEELIARTIPESTVEKEDEIEYINQNKDMKKNKEDIIRVFNNHNLNFYDLYDEDQKELIEYGNYDKINDILNTFDRYKIYLGSLHNNEVILKIKSSQIKVILLYSKKEIIEEVFDTIKKYKIFLTEEGMLDTVKLLERPQKFIEKKMRYKRKNSGIININKGNPGKNPYIGTASDFIKNLEFFMNLGVNKEYYMTKCDTVQEVNHELIKINKIIFDMYGLKPEDYLETLSCFRVKSPDAIIDLFIEMGSFRYVKEHMSVVQFNLEEKPEYYMVAALLRFTNLTWRDITYPNSYKLRTTKLKQELLKLGITLENCYTHFYTPLTTVGVAENNKQRENVKQFFNKYDSIIDRSYNYDTTIALNSKDSIIPELDEKYLLRDGNGKMIHPTIYNFGTVKYEIGKNPDTNEPIYKKWDINISRNKVLRMYNTLLENGIENNIDTIMYAITKNSIITLEEYNIIKNKVQNILEKGRNRK